MQVPDSVRIIQEDQKKLSELNPQQQATQLAKKILNISQSSNPQQEAIKLASSIVQDFLVYQKRIDRLAIEIEENGQYDQKLINDKQNTIVHLSKSLDKYRKETKSHYDNLAHKFNNILLQKDKEIEILKQQITLSNTTTHKQLSPKSPPKSQKSNSFCTNNCTECNCAKCKCPSCAEIDRQKEERELAMLMELEERFGPTY